MNLECATSDFTHIYILAEDGTVYTDKFVSYSPGSDNVNRSLDFLPYFVDGKERVILRFDDKATGGWLTKESILYGIRLNNYEVDGVKMLALIGISDISSIQDNMVINSFIKEGSSRGNSFLIDKEGNYIIDVNKKIYLNKQDNLYDHLSEASNAELTNEEVAQKLNNLETFSFYHTHTEDDERELLYFIPLTEDIDLYFIMSVRDVVFLEQTKTFTTMSMTMLAVSMVTIIGMNHLMMLHIDDEGQKAQMEEWLKKSHSTANYLLSLVNDIL